MSTTVTPRIKINTSGDLSYGQEFSLPTIQTSVPVIFNLTFGTVPVSLNVTGYHVLMVNPPSTNLVDIILGGVSGDVGITLRPDSPSLISVKDAAIFFSAASTITIQCMLF